MNKMLFGKEAREKLRLGVEKSFKAISPTLGPKGRSAILGYGSRYNSSVLDDGVSIAEFIVLEDPFENEGAKLIKEVATRTNDIVGDGTTTSTVLAHSMLENSLGYINSGVSPALIKKGINRAVAFVSKELEKMSTPICGYEDVKKVATISANNDEMGKKVADAIEAVKGGLVSVEEGTEQGINVEVIDGMQFYSGYAHPYFGIKSNTGKCILNSPLIAIVDKNISSYDEIMPMMVYAKKESKPLLIVCENIQATALSLAVKNFVEDRLNLCIIKSPSGGINKKELLNDLAMYTGGNVIGNDYGDDISKFNPINFGKATTVTVDSQYTIIRSNIDKECLKDRIEQIDSELSTCKDPARLEHLKLRKAGLTSGIALIKVCAKTFTETNAQMAKVEDAKNAALTSIKGGVIPGGGTALISLYPKLEKEIQELYNSTEISDGERDGMKAVLLSLKEPVRVIADNTGADGSYVTAKIIDHITSDPKNINYGFDADSEEYVDMVEKGILDATLSTKASLENAASVVSTVIMTEFVSCIEEENK